MHVQSSSATQIDAHAEIESNLCVLLTPAIARFDSRVGQRKAWQVSSYLSSGILPVHSITWQ